MYLYLDLIWLLNFFINYLLLWMTAIFRKVDMNKWRFMIASGIGSLYVLFLFIPPLQSFYTFVFKIGLSVVIIQVAFGFGHLQNFMANFLTFYFVSFVTGGGMLAIHFILKNENEILDGMILTQSSGYGDPISWWFVIIGFPIMYWFSRQRWTHIEKTKAKEHILVDVCIGLKGKTVECRGLIDTGNQLYEPFSKTPVMMVEMKQLKPYLPQSLFESLERRQPFHQLDLELDENQDWMTRLRIIPFRGIGKQSELMVAIRPDYVQVIDTGRETMTEKVLLGLHDQPLSQDGLFQAIVHPELTQMNQVEEAENHVGQG